MLQDLYVLSKKINETLDNKIVVDVVLYLNEAKHENLQQEAYKSHNKSFRGYLSKKVFEIIISNIKFIIKLKK